MPAGVVPAEVGEVFDEQIFEMVRGGRFGRHDVQDDKFCIADLQTSRGVLVESRHIQADVHYRTGVKVVHGPRFDRVETDRLPRAKIARAGSVFDRADAECGRRSIRSAGVPDRIPGPEQFGVCECPARHRNGRKGHAVAQAVAFGQ